MKTPRISPQLLLGIALSAVFSLAIAQGFALVRLIFGAGPASPWSIAGSVVGLICCSIAARYGLRQMHRHGAC
jgi:predicted membrane protein